MDGLITSSDVQLAHRPIRGQALSHATLSSGDGSVVPLTRPRKAVATNMVASKQQVPHFYLMADVDMTQVNALRAYTTTELNWDRPPTYTDVLVRACAQVLSAMPAVNVSYSEDGLIQHQEIGIGVAVDTEAGLVVPIISDAHRLALKDLSQRIRNVVGRAREMRMKPADMSGKSLVISNLGMYGVDAFVAIIDMPDPMILAVGRISDRVIPLNGQVAIKPMCTLTLSVDHRALDGAQGAKFLEAVKRRLENPFDIL